LNSTDKKYYYGNGKEFTGTFVNPAASFPCVATDDSALFEKVDCAKAKVCVSAYY
jgi:hypothetical protein